jgi:outer membrane protein insertion porin family
MWNFSLDAMALGCFERRKVAGILLLFLLLSFPAAASETTPVINSVALLGTMLPVNLTAQAGQPYDASSIRKDVRALWSTGRFEDIRVETAQSAGRVSIIFRVTEATQWQLHEIRIEPSTRGLHPKQAEGTPVNHFRAHEIALEARNQLNAEGYLHARVDEKLIPVSGRKADLLLTVHQGDPVDIKEVEFQGTPGIDTQRLRSALRAMRVRRVLPGVPGLWHGWKLFPAYNPEAVESDIRRLQSMYLAKGYFDATVRLEDTAIHGKSAHVNIDVQAGPLYQVRDWRVSDGSVETVRAKDRPMRELCSCLLTARRAAERSGVLDFSASLNVERVGDPATADLSAAIQAGPSYRVGRIEFIGNHRYTDAAVRRKFSLDEGQPLDRGLLRKSIARLNQTLQFDPIDDHALVVQPHPVTGEADVFVRLTERQFRAWAISGPVGPASLAGPLQASLSSRLPGWGQGMLELSTYVASISLVAFAQPLIPWLAASAVRFQPVLAIQRPFTPGEGWKSGFIIAPQIGWQRSVLSYASTQLQNRLRPAPLEPELPVSVSRPQGDVAMLCEPGGPRLAALRLTAALAARFLGAIASL